jgi:hypothetical protein
MSNSDVTIIKRSRFLTYFWGIGFGVLTVPMSLFGLFIGLGLLVTRDGSALAALGVVLGALTVIAVAAALFYVYIIKRRNIHFEVQVSDTSIDVITNDGKQTFQKSDVKQVNVFAVHHGRSGVSVTNFDIVTKKNGTSTQNIPVEFSPGKLEKALKRHGYAYAARMGTFAGPIDTSSHPEVTIDEKTVGEPYFKLPKQKPWHIILLLAAVAALCLSLFITYKTGYVPILRRTNHGRESWALLGLWFAGVGFFFAYIRTLAGNKQAATAFGIVACIGFVFLGASLTTTAERKYLDNTCSRHRQTRSTHSPRRIITECIDRETGEYKWW